MHSSSHICSFLCVMCDIAVLEFVDEEPCGVDQPTMSLTAGAAATLSSSVSRHTRWVLIDLSCHYIEGSSTDSSNRAKVHDKGARLKGKQTTINNNFKTRLCVCACSRLCICRHVYGGRPCSCTCEHVFLSVCAHMHMFFKRHGQLRTCIEVRAYNFTAKTT